MSRPMPTQSEKCLRFVIVAVIAFLPTAAVRAKGEKPPTDLEIRNILIKESIAAYPGNCPCPYSVARNGSRCGGRSAWSRPGGAAPYCYPKDVPDTEVQAYREQHKVGLTCST